MAEPTACCVVAGTHCARVDALFNHDGVHVIDVSWRGDQLSLTVESHPGPVGCPGCGPDLGHDPAPGDLALL